MEQVEAIAHESFRAWEEPCCSVFRAHYGGRTDSSAREKDDEIALAWTDAWPSSLGDETTTIGVTMSEISGIGSRNVFLRNRGSCSIIRAIGSPPTAPGIACAWQMSWFTKSGT